MTGPDPAVARQRLLVRRAVDGLPPGALVLVACSGGTDSLALAGATAFVAPRAGLRAGAVVVDHGLQPGSDAVARAAAQQCAGLGLDPVLVRRVVVGRSGAHGGPEAAARVARYAALEDEARSAGAVTVLLGHTLDDQAETVLLGLARGSGARALAGMPSGRGLVRRPFLEVRRSETERACRALGLEPWHDPTNAPGAAPVRSRVRHEVMPVLERVLGPGVAEALARTADQLAADDAALAGLAEDLLARSVVAPAASGSTALTLDVAVLAGAADAVRRRALRAALVRAGVPDGALHRVHVLAVDALVTDWHGQGAVALPGGRAARRRCGRLTVCLAGARGEPGRDGQDQHDEHGRDEHDEHDEHDEQGRGANGGRG